MKCTNLKCDTGATSKKSFAVPFNFDACVFNRRFTISIHSRLDFIIHSESSRFLHIRFPLPIIAYYDRFYSRMAIEYNLPIFAVKKRFEWKSARFACSQIESVFISHYLNIKSRWREACRREKVFALKTRCRETFLFFLQQCFRLVQHSDFSLRCTPWINE